MKKKILIASLVFGAFSLVASSAFAELQGQFNLSERTTTYSAGAEGTNYEENLDYSYVHENEITGNKDKATRATFTEVGVRRGKSKPSGAQFGTYKIVNADGEKRYHYFFSDSIEEDQSHSINYKVDVQDLYTEMVVYADKKGVDGMQGNIVYDRFAYTP
ncbi:hypothetical protein [Brevibacillus sp. 179-C9.3 HS]|uniref:hypothetical protein n=1 Tax=unclassified Brevibacillus TaxID=2684853 RepID=UPI0039A00047